MIPTAGNSDDASRRAALRAEVRSAARVAAPLWPAETFIAVNPLLGLQDIPFEDAVKVARRELGASGYRSMESFRSDLDSGRIDRRHLAEALLAAIPDMASLKPIEIAGRAIDPFELLLADLIGATEPPAPERLETAAARCDEILGTAIAPRIDRIVAGWLSAWFDEGSAAWAMPRGEDGLYATFRMIAPADRGLRRLIDEPGRAALNDLPLHPEDAIEAALGEMAASATRRGEEMRAQVVRMPGWAGHVKWRTEWAGEGSESPEADLVELLAIRMTVESLAVSAQLDRVDFDPGTGLEGWRRSDRHGHEAAADERLTSALRSLDIESTSLDSAARATAHATLARLGFDERPAIWLAAQEISYRDGLLSRIHPAGGDPETSVPGTSNLGRPDAQAVFCIDVRSEGIRRRLEQAGNFETLGFAGFFAVAIGFRELGATASTAQCPVLLSPSVEIDEQPAEGSMGQAERALEARAAGQSLTHAFHGAKEGVASPFALAEAGGLVAGPFAAIRTFATGLAARLSRRASKASSPLTRVEVNASADRQGGFSDEEQVFFGHAALTMMGLTERFGRLVALCAHGSHTVNNPYASSLDCGACGGNQGGPNARVAAAILNRPAVRYGLAGMGIEIPEDTWFVAARHDTTSDIVSVLDRDLIPESHASDLEAFEEGLRIAGEELARERAGRIPGGSPRGGIKSAERRGHDWAQIRPEWGLAGNAAFIIGDRSITKGLDLECRTFLHSYRTECDPDGSALETILTAPLVVAQWINSQYYFSSVDPEIFGAGDKALHNVTGRSAIVQGGGGDLRVGLPWQSVGVGDSLVHEPMRLLAVVEAPIERIERIINENRVLQELFAGGWVSLVARDDARSDWSVRSRRGTWSTWVPAEEKSILINATEVIADEHHGAHSHAEG